MHNSQPFLFDGIILKLLNCNVLNTHLINKNLNVIMKKKQKKGIVVKMNVTLPKEKALRKREIIIYISIVSFCIISIIVAFYVQFYTRTDLATLIGIGESKEYGEKTEEEIQLLKSNFDQLFNNSIDNVSEQNNEKRKDKSKSIVYTGLEKKESKVNSFDMEVHIPHINIDNKIIDGYNKEIEDVFKSKTESILASENKNVIYTVEYTANIEYDILSLIIRSNLKEGTSAQRVIIQTYNYDLRNNKQISLEEVLKIKNINKDEIQKKIKSEIELEQRKVEDLKKLGYNIYSRDSLKDIYLVENSKEFYLTDKALYVIYAYGNETFTSEMDMVII